MVVAVEELGFSKIEYVIRSPSSLDTKTVKLPHNEARSRGNQIE